MSVSATPALHGSGAARLVLVRADTGRADDQQHEFPLLPDITVLGSGADADVVLAGLDERHAEIRRDANDDYVYIHLGGIPATFVDGHPRDISVLRPGNRIKIGPWVFSYVRAD